MSETKPEYNFCRVSQRDALAFGSGRPGFPSKSVTQEQLEPWISFMQGQGIKRVLSLLGDDEKEEYYPTFDLDAVMSSAFGEDRYTRTSVFKESAREKMSNAIRAAHDSKEPIVIHCSGGEGRAALGMGLWLVDIYGLAPQDAAKEITDETALHEGVARKVNVPKLTYLVQNGSMIAFQK